MKMMKYKNFTQAECEVFVGRYRIKFRSPVKLRSKTIEPCFEFISADSQLSSEFGFYQHGFRDISTNAFLSAQSPVYQPYVEFFTGHLVIKSLCCFGADGFLCFFLPAFTNIDPCSDFRKLF